MSGRFGERSTDAGLCVRSKGTLGRDIDGDAFFREGPCFDFSGPRDGPARRCARVRVLASLRQQRRGWADRDGGRDRNRRHDCDGGSNGNRGHDCDGGRDGNRRHDCDGRRDRNRRHDCDGNRGRDGDGRRDGNRRHDDDGRHAWIRRLGRNDREGGRGWGSRQRWRWRWRLRGCRLHGHGRRRWCGRDGNRGHAAHGLELVEHVPVQHQRDA